MIPVSWKGVVYEKVPQGNCSTFLVQAVGVARASGRAANNSKTDLLITNNYRLYGQI